MVEVILKRFDDPDEVTQFDKGVFETVTIGGMTMHFLGAGKYAK